MLWVELGRLAIIAVEVPRIATLACIATLVQINAVTVRQDEQERPQVRQVILICVRNALQAQLHQRGLVVVVLVRQARMPQRQQGLVALVMGGHIVLRMQGVAQIVTLVNSVLRIQQVAPHARVLPILRKGAVLVVARQCLLIITPQMVSQVQIIGMIMVLQEVLKYRYLLVA